MKFDLIEFDRFDRFRCFPVFSANKATRLFHSGGEQDEEMCLRVCVCVPVCVCKRAFHCATSHASQKKHMCCKKKCFASLDTFFFHFGTSFDQFPIAMGIQSSTIHRQIQEDPVSYYLLITAALCCLICVLK
jgi:hypothetical protein